MEGESLGVLDDNGGLQHHMDRQSHRGMHVGQSSS